MKKYEKVMAAYWKEWRNLEAKGTWRWDALIEWDTIAAKARVEEKEIHFGYLFGFMAEKGSEFEAGDLRRYFKYRVVFQGNMVKNQNRDIALFQVMASTPATLEASKYADAYACFPGHSLSGRDVEQAYLRATLKGRATYVMLPQESWTLEMWKLKCSVVKLEKARCGQSWCVLAGTLPNAVQSRGF